MGYCQSILPIYCAKDYSALPFSASGRYYIAASRAERLSPQSKLKLKPNPLLIAKHSLALEPITFQLFFYRLINVKPPVLHLPVGKILWAVSGISGMSGVVFFAYSAGAGRGRYT